MGRVDFCSIETSKLLGSKGFIFSRYFGSHFYHNGELYNDPIIRTASGEVVDTIRQSEAQKWLRDTHGIDIWVVPEWTDHTHSKVEYIGFYCGRMPWEEEDPITEDDYFDTYEEALESTLKQALELI